VLAVYGLDADDRSDDGDRDAEARFGRGEFLCMYLHEAPPGGDALRLYEASAVGLPRAHARIPGGHDGLDYGGKGFGPAE
jgi:hypothetical protein